MILAYTSAWIDHLRYGGTLLARLLNNGAVLAHPWITGELALGNLSQRADLIGLLRGLPQATVASDDEILTLIAREVLPGTGIGYVDAQLLAATRLTTDATLWTRDKRLLALSAKLGMEFTGERCDTRPF